MPIPRLLYFLVPAFLTELAMFMTWVATPIYALQRFDAAADTLGALGALSWGFYGIIALLAGWISDRTARLPWMILSLVGTGAAIFALPFASGVAPFLVAAVLTTGLLGFFWAPLQSLLSETATPRRLLREMMGFNIGWSCGTLLGSYLVKRLIELGRTEAIFHVAGCVILAALAFIVCFRPRRLPLAPGEDLAPDPRAPRLKHLSWLALFGNFFILNMLIYVFPKIAQTPPFNLAEAEVAHLQLVRTAAMVLAFALLAVFTLWRFRYWPLHVGFALMLALLAGIAAAPGMPGLTLAFAALGLTGAASYAFSAFYSMLSPVRKGMTMATHELLLASGNMLGPMLAGVVLQHSSDPQLTLLTTLAPLPLVWALAVWFQFRRTRSKLTSQSS